MSSFPTFALRALYRSYLLSILLLTALALAGCAKRGADGEVVQTGTVMPNWWSLYEFNVYP